MGRAVQKASIYPEGHPAVPVAVEGFLEGLRRAREDAPLVSIGIASDRFLVDGEPLLEKKGILPWLATHLHERGLAEVSLAQNLAEDTVIRFVRWLAKPVTGPIDQDTLTAFEGITLTRFDYGRARFGEDPAASGAIADDSIRAWHSMMSGMLKGMSEDWGIETDGLAWGDPTALAECVNAVVGRQGGPDAGSVASRVIAAGVSLKSLAEPIQKAVKKRLGQFLAGLTPELRSQLLRVSVQSSRQKIEFVAEVVDSLPKSLVVEVLGGLNERGARVPHQFITLMNKLIGLSADDAPLKEQVGRKLESMGVPRALMEDAPGKVREVLTEVMQSRVELNWNPERYQALLEDLSSRRVEGGQRARSERYGDPRDPDTVAAHVSEIALRLFAARPEAPEAEEFLKCLEADAPRALGSGRFEQAHEAVSAVRAVCDGGVELPPEFRMKLESYLSGYAQEDRIEKILSAAEAGLGTLGPEIVGLFKLAGAEAIFAAFRRIAGLDEGPEVRRLSELLTHADPEPFTSAIGLLRSEGWSSLRVLFPVLLRIGAPRGVELALTFVGNEDPRVRIEALRVLMATDRREGQIVRYLERAFADRSHRVTAFAVAQARQRGGPEMTVLLGAFLRGGTGGSRDDEVQAQAIAVLAATKTPEARDILAALLASRKVMFSVKEMRIATALEDALEQIGDETALRGVGAWRRSFTRWISMLLVKGRVKAQ